MTNKRWIWAIDILIIVAICVLAYYAHGADLDWARFTGKVKAINLKASTVTIQNDEGDLFTIPVDYQVTLIIGKGKHAASKGLKDVLLDDRITLIRTPAEKPKDDMEGLVPYRGMP